MLLRTLWIFLNRRRLKPSSVHEVTEYEMRVYPQDLDLLMHVNNGVYLSMMDFGRWDMVFRSGIYDVCKKNNWYAVVAGEQIKFKKSLTLWNKFKLQTQFVGHDERYFFIKQKFIYKEELMATGLVKVRFLKKKGGVVTPDELMNALGESAPPTPEISNEWFAFESKHLS